MAKKKTKKEFGNEAWHFLLWLEPILGEVKLDKQKTPINVTDF